MRLVPEAGDTTCRTVSRRKREWGLHDPFANHRPERLSTVLSIYGGMFLGEKLRWHSIEIGEGPEDENT